MKHLLLDASSLFQISPFFLFFFSLSRRFFARCPVLQRDIFFHTQTPGKGWEDARMDNRGLFSGALCLYARGRSQNHDLTVRLVSKWKNPGCIVRFL